LLAHGRNSAPLVPKSTGVSGATAQAALYRLPSTSGGWYLRREIRQTPRIRQRPAVPWLRIAL
jgi:hypothetical protein